MKKIFLVMFLLLFLLISCGKPNIISVGSGPDCTTVNCGPISIINGSTEYIDTPQAYIDATPRQIIGSGNVQINFMSKTSNVTTNAAFCYNGNYLSPSKLDFFNPHNDSVSMNYTCAGNFNYTLNPNHFWCYSATNGSLVFDHDFLTGNSSSKTAFWNNTIPNNWTTISGGFTKVNISFDNKTNCYVKTNINLVAGQKYTTRISIDAPYIPIGMTQEEAYPGYDGKYGVAFWPSSYGMNYTGAITDNKFFYLDPSVNLTNGLVLYFNGTSTTDVTSHYSLTSISNIVQNTSFGFIGQNKSFQFLNGAVDSAISNASVFNSQSNYTSCVWVYPTSNADANAIGGVGIDTTSIYDIMATQVASSGKWAVWGQDFSSNVSSQTNIWTYECFTHDYTNAQLRIYINGSLSGTKAITDSSNALSFVLGSGYSGSHLIGYATHMSLWSRILNQTEITALWNNGSGLDYPFVQSTPISFTQIPGNISTKTYYGTILNLQYNITNGSGCNYLNWSTNNSDWGITQNGLMSASGQNTSKAGFWAVNVSVSDTCGNLIYTILGINVTNDSISFTQGVGNITANHNGTPNIYAIKINVTSNAASCVLYNFSSNDSTHPIFNVSGWFNLTGPNISATGVSYVNITARDNCSNIISLWPSLSWINVTNTPPGLTCGDNTKFRYYRNISLCNTTAVDSDNDPVTLSENNSCAAISGTNITYSFTGSESCVGLQNVVIGASDGNINTTTTLNLNITNVSNNIIAYCPGIVRLRFSPNITFINISTLLTTQNVLANGTTVCTFIINTTGEEASLRFLAQTNYSNNSYVIQFGNTNLTSTQTLISTVAPNTTSLYNVTGYWVNATPSFPIRLSINVTP